MRQKQLYNCRTTHPPTHTHMHTIENTEQIETREQSYLKKKKHLVFWIRNAIDNLHEKKKIRD